LLYQNLLKQIKSETEVYLFDWGNTLMIDFPDAKGKMCDWEIVKTVDGANETLKSVSRTAKIYIATGAADSTELEIKKAFSRVDLNRYISGYFCKENTGIQKGSTEFLESILKQLNITANKVAIVGDSYAMDIEPALKVGINTIWLNPNNNKSIADNVLIINSLSELC